MKCALIIFVKKPEAGKVKTRLAVTLGNKKALEIYLQLLEHTRSIVKSVAADKFVFYVDTPGKNDLWEHNIFNKKIQHGKTLGNKMLNAFNEMFGAGYEKVSIIGSDCFELTTAIINQGFTELESCDLVIGPASDGGYYFLGMKKMHAALFASIEWSTEKVLRQTTAVCVSKQLTYRLLAELNDIDVETDWLKAMEQFPL
ncbi:MAG: TIGR04282 family arsenosugar biosynthesis glycosyltransferase [Ginsengibacter sp.]